MLAIIMLVAVPLLAQVSQPQSLSGSVYQNVSGTSTAKAVAAASVYVHDVNASDPSAWTGPVLTDSYGRFGFYGLTGSRYLLRIYDAADYRLWEAVVNVPSTLKPIVVRDITVAYYPKSADGFRVEDTLETLGYPYKEFKAVNNVATNAVWFGDAVPIDDVKRVAAGLIKVGVKLKAIRRFRMGAGPKAKCIEVGASPSVQSRPTLQPDTISSATDFPRASP